MSKASKQEKNEEIKVLYKSEEEMKRALISLCNEYLNLVPGKIEKYREKLNNALGAKLVIRNNFEEFKDIDIKLVKNITTGTISYERTWNELSWVILGYEKEIRYLEQIEIVEKLIEKENSFFRKIFK